MIQGWSQTADQSGLSSGLNLGISKDQTYTREWGEGWGGGDSRFVPEQTASPVFISESMGWGHVVGVG